MRILQLEPSAGGSCDIQHELKECGVQAEFTRTASPEEFVQSLESGVFDAVVVNDALLRRTSLSQAQCTPDRLARQHAAMSRLIGVVQELSLARDMQQIIDVVRRAARRLTRADGAAFVMREGEHAHYIAESASAPPWSGRRAPLNECISGWAIEEGRPIMIADLAKEAHAAVERFRAMPIRSVAAIPIRSADPLGAICVYWKELHKCTAHELMLLEALANTTAVAIDNVRVCANLERLVEERTRDLQAANQELEAFTSAASHDLRAPLRAMSAAVELLDAGSQENAPLRKEQLRELVHSMNRLIDDLLRLSRISRTELKLERCDLGALAEAIMQRLALAQPHRRVQWSRRGSMTVIADPGLMSIALDNLLSNAWKYSAQRAPAQISFTSRTDEQGRRVFTVADNGAGFDPREAHRLFKPFQRLHSDREFAGAGLGLATVQRVIERHGGAIQSHAAPDQGARFSFTLTAPPRAEE